MNAVVKAAREWQSFNPDVNCTCTSHYKLDGSPLDDHLVCDRERAWRRYVKLRDTGAAIFDTARIGEYVPNRLFTGHPDRKGQPLLQEERNNQ